MIHCFLASTDAWLHVFNIIHHGSGCSNLIGRHMYSTRRVQSPAELVRDLAIFAARLVTLEVAIDSTRQKRKEAFYCTYYGKHFACFTAVHLVRPRDNDRLSSWHKTWRDPRIA